MWLQWCVTGHVSIAGARADQGSQSADRNKRKVKFKNCATFTYCISKITIRG